MPLFGAQRVMRIKGNPPIAKTAPKMPIENSDDERGDSMTTLFRHRKRRLRQWRSFICSRCRCAPDIRYTSAHGEAPQLVRVAGDACRWPGRLLCGGRSSGPMGASLGRALDSAFVLAGDGQAG